MNRYRASIATAVLGVAALSHGQTLGKSSFSSSMIASAFSKFHGVKAPSRTAPPTVAAQTKLEAAPIQQPLIKIASPSVTAQTVAQKPKTTGQSSAKQAQTVASNAKPKSSAKSPLQPYVAGKDAITAEEADRFLHSVAMLEGGPMGDPDSIGVELVEPGQPGIDLQTQQPGTRNLKVKWVSEGYFDIGYSKLIGTFNTQMLRYGARYGQDDLHVYVKNESLDTHGTGLPFPQAITGMSTGIEARHWFPGDQMFVVASYAKGLSGFNEGKTDIRYGAAGSASWKDKYNRWYSDLYGELFYIQLAKDIFFDGRIRSGRIWHVDRNGFSWAYVVGQFWAAGVSSAGTENRMETGIGVGYLYREAISLNFELRAGYSFRDPIDSRGDKQYINPTIILAGSFYKGWKNKDDK